MTRTQQLAKFHRCLEFAAEPLPLDSAPRLIEAMDRLEEIVDVRFLAALAAARSR